MSKKWCHNAYTGEIFSYNQCDDLTDFPRGDFLAYGDYLTTGISSKEKAIEWAKEWGRCDKCKSSKTANENGKCKYCGSEIKFIEIKHAS